MGTAFGAEGGVVSELSEYGSMRWIRCCVGAVLSLCGAVCWAHFCGCFGVCGSVHRQTCLLLKGTALGVWRRWPGAVMPAPLPCFSTVFRLFWVRV